MTESVETIEQDNDAEVSNLFGEDGGDAPSYHTILEVWREVLTPARTEQHEPVTAAWANRMINTYPEIRYADMEEFRDRYFAKIIQLLEILELEIESDDTALDHLDPEEDATLNADHYKNLLLQWQLAITQWEKDWACTDPYAGVELGTISEVHKQVFGQVGLTQYLDTIQFEYTEADQADLAEAINELREGQ